MELASYESVVVAKTRLFLLEMDDQGDPVGIEVVLGSLRHKKCWSEP